MKIYKMKSFFILIIVNSLSFFLCAQSGRNNRENVLLKDTVQTERNRLPVNSGNKKTERIDLRRDTSSAGHLILSRSNTISSEDSAAVFSISDYDLGSRSFDGKLPVKNILPILDISKAKAQKLILSAKVPKLDNSNLRFGSADIDFETGKVNFTYRVDPQYLVKTSSGSTITPGGGFYGYSINEVIKLDKRSYEFFNGYVGAKVYLKKNKKYLAQFSVESVKTIDYSIWISKSYKEVVVTSSGKATLPGPNKHYFFSGKKKVNIVVEPGMFDGEYYIILAGNFQNGNWSFDRFEMIEIE